MVNKTELPKGAEVTTEVRNKTELPEAEENYQYETPIGPQPRTVNANQYEQEAGPTRADLNAEKQRKFEQDQEKWNLEQKQKAKDEEYEEEQKKIVEARKLKPIQQTAAEKIKTGISNAAAAGWGNLKKNLSKPVQRADAIREKNAQGTGNLTKADVAKMIRAGKAKPTKGQFTSPKYGGGFGGGGKVSGTFPDIDPFGGMGGRGRNMLDIGFGSMGQGPQRQQPQAPVRQPPPRPRPTQMKFPDPFAGLKTGRKELPEKIMGKGLGIGSGKKSAKKIKRMDDWMDF